MHELPDGMYQRSKMHVRKFSENGSIFAKKSRKLEERDIMLYPSNTHIS